MAKRGWSDFMSGSDSSRRFNIDSPIESASREAAAKDTPTSKFMQSPRAKYEKGKYEKPSPELLADKPIFGEGTSVSVRGEVSSDKGGRSGRLQSGKIVVKHKIPFSAPDTASKGAASSAKPQGKSAAPDDDEEDDD